MEQPNSFPGKVLLCEDETLIALDIQRTLENCGFHVTGVADNGPDALIIADHTRPDIVLMDIGLRGGMNGIEVASSLRRTFDIPSIFLTSNNSSETFEAAKCADPYAFLTKPIDYSQLRRTLDLGIQRRIKEKALKEEVKSNASQVDILMQRFPMSYDEEGRSMFASMVRIAGGISHHLNNMLFVIQGNLEWLSACNTVEGYEKQYVLAALKTCERASDFVKQLSWASGRGKFEIKVAAVRSLVERSLEEVKANINCEVVVSGNDFKVFVEDRMVIEAIKALVMNADEASSYGQKIEINLFEVDGNQFQLPSDQLRLNKCVAIEVKDSGKGFSAKMAELLMEPFITSHDLKRFGLGLSVARGVCFAHDGWFTISSKEDMGTTARMFLPLDAEERIRVDEDESEENFVNEKSIM